MTIRFAPVSHLSSMLANGECSSEELTRSFLRLIDEQDKHYNSFITVCHERAIEQAKQADQLRRKGEGGMLCGIPIAHKDIFCTRGIRTTCASRMLENFIAPYDATVVARLAAAGAVMLGKTNMDEFAMGSSCEHSTFGVTRNPWATDCVPGGSSGGSAAAVAAGLVAAATGTDTGGSVRQPAALCGVTGLKPGYGRVSRYGMIAFASSLDQAGTLTRTAEDAALLLSVMGGHDPLDSTSIPGSAENYLLSLREPRQNLRIGLVREWHHSNDPMTGVIADVANQFESLGHRIEEITLPHVELGLSVYYVLCPAECSSNLARYDGVRYGYRCSEPSDLAELITRSRTEGFGLEVKRRILVGTYVLSEGYYDAYYRRAQCVRRLIKEDFSRAFKQVDVILAPTAPGPCFKLGECDADPLRLYRQDLYTIPANLAGLPALSMPAGSEAGKPLAAQLIGPDLSEALLLGLAHDYQQQTSWHRQHPSGIEPN